MHPAILVALGLGGGFLGYKMLKGGGSLPANLPPPEAPSFLSNFLMPPTADAGTVTTSSFQIMPTFTPNGTPIKVATPISPTVTIAQATATPTKAPVAGQYTPVPTTVPKVGVTFAPPGTLAIAPDGKGVLQPAPIIITPTGAASIAVGSVKDIQHALNTLGYAKPPLKEDGKFGPKTSAAIKNFQSKNKLVIDGNAGPTVSAALSASLTNIAGSSSATGTAVQNSNPQTGVTLTLTGTPVNTSSALKMTAIDIQRALNTLGASPPLKVDGKLGPKSVAAVKSFQTAHGLTPDGIAGPKTKTALYLAITTRQ